MDVKTISTSSLQRVFLDGKCDLTCYNKASALKGERFSYQIAYKSSDRFFAKIKIDSPLSSYVTIRQVGNVPSELPVFKSDCKYYERTEAGLFPDVLYPIKSDEILIKPNNWYSLWITVELPDTIEAGKYNIDIEMICNDEKVSSNTFVLTVINAALPKQELIYTQWFHCDSIANYYNTKVFSEKFWALAENFIKAAVHTGVNMLLTPIFTPPIDTEIGGERLTVQLIDITVSDGKYEFRFDKFIRWINMAKKCGIKYFEMSHLFSQWGAKYTPKIVATVNGNVEQIFGWNTSADSPKYSEFLQAFLPELIRILHSLGIEKNTFFHVSDEPNEEQIQSYSAAKSIIDPILKDFKIIDALSDYRFYENNIVSHPIPCTSEIENFIKNGFPHPWTYYCCGQGEKLSNRFFGMPLSATRAIGLQFFKYNIEGFLQWGFNFYNSQLSKRTINPFAVTDADAAFPSGDSFTVYPGENGALESVRSEVFYEALQDMRAMKLLSDLNGKEAVVFSIEKEYGEITFTNYPRGTQNMLNLRENINFQLDKTYIK